MRIEIRNEGLELTPPLKRHLEKRLRFSLGRFGRRLDQVHVRLKDVNGPRGGQDMHCKIQAQIRNGGPRLVVEEQQLDPFSAISRASDRMSYAISRRLGRANQRRRRGGRPAHRNWQNDDRPQQQEGVPA